MTDEERYMYDKNIDSISVEKTLVNAAIRKGEAKKSIEIAKNLKSLGVDIDIIAQGTGLSKEEIKKL